MKIVSLGYFCCLVIAIMSANVFSEENQELTSSTVNCEQQALDSGLDAGEEFDNYVAECEIEDNIFEEASPEELIVDSENEVLD